MSSNFESAAVSNHYFHQSANCVDEKTENNTLKVLPPKQIILHIQFVPLYRSISKTCSKLSGSYQIIKDHIWYTSTTKHKTCISS